jgi:P27 family predicted phage terminase small subunit
VVPRQPREAGSAGRSDAGTALEVVGDTPPAPPGLEGKGLESWNRLWDAGKGHLSARADYVLMEQLCWALDEKDELRCWVAEDRMGRSWYTTANGQTVTHPSVKRIEQIDAQTTSWLAQLGFTPSDRARLGLLEVRTPDELDDFRRRQGQRARLMEMVAGRRGSLVLIGVVSSPWRPTVAGAERQ